MIIVDDFLISDELFEKTFVCNLDACKGECCVAGDEGAPLKKEEAELLEKEYPNFKEYITQKGIESVEKNGLYIKNENEFTTPLIEGKECAFTIFENGIAKCGIEKAHAEGKTNFKKPSSCHLYPIRVKELKSVVALNYHKWDICSAACELGEQLQQPVFRFLKQAIIHEWGDKFYMDLERIYENKFVNNS